MAAEEVFMPVISYQQNVRKVQKVKALALQKKGLFDCYIINDIIGFVNTDATMCKSHFTVWSRE